MSVESSTEAHIVFLHGYGMQEQDLAAFAPSLGLRAQFHFLRAPLALAQGGRAWWAVDEAAKALALREGPRDLCLSRPEGRIQARVDLAAQLRCLQTQHPQAPLYLVGFSQGGMLACETLLHEPIVVQGMALLSASRLAFDEWQAHMFKLAGLPVFVAHGRSDADLSFAAGEALQQALVDAGAQVQWLPFEGGHQIPFIVWRGLRKFLLAQGIAPAPKMRQMAQGKTHD